MLKLIYYFYFEQNSRGGAVVRLWVSTPDVSGSTPIGGNFWEIIQKSKNNNRGINNHGPYEFALKRGFLLGNRSEPPYTDYPPVSYKGTWLGSSRQASVKQNILKSLFKV